MTVAFSVLEHQSAGLLSIAAHLAPARVDFLVLHVRLRVQEPFAIADILRERLVLVAVSLLTSPTTHSASIRRQGWRPSGRLPIPASQSTASRVSPRPLLTLPKIKQAVALNAARSRLRCRLLQSSPS